MQGAGAGGIYLAGEYWAQPYSWLNLRGYVGFMSTSTQQKYCQLAGGCNVSEDIGFLGGKLRLVVPIPYVAPFLEVGLGVTFGTMHATDVGVDQTTNGIISDVPFGFGLSCGPKHEVDVGFFFLPHPGTGAFAGAIDVGVSIPGP